MSRSSSQKPHNSLVEFCRNPSATNGKVLLVEQFHNGHLYASLAKGQLQPSDLAQGVEKLRKYLDHRKTNSHNYSAGDALNFLCHCPLCRGEKGVHYTRVFKLAYTVYAAVYFSQHTDPPKKNDLNKRRSVSTKQCNCSGQTRQK